MNDKQLNGLSLFYHGVRWFFCFTILLLASCAAAPDVAEEVVDMPAIDIEIETDIETGTFTRIMMVDGVERSYIIYVPAQAAEGGPLPLLLNLHGFTGTAESQMGYADFRPIADREGFVVIYPEGTLLGSSTHWNTEGLFERFGVDSQADDVGFLSLLIETTAEDYNIDTGRVYAIGHSNGGYMSIDLACQIGEQITAVASVAGTMTPEIAEACQPAHPTPLLQIHGTSDSVVPYEGASWTKSVDELLEYWIEVNGVDSEPMVVEVAQSSETTADSTMTRLQFSSADGDVLVEHIRVNNGKHDWPGQEPFGVVNVDLDINEEIWAFLSQFELDDLR